MYASQTSPWFVEGGLSDLWYLHLSCVYLKCSSVSVIAETWLMEPRKSFPRESCWCRGDSDMWLIYFVCLIREHKYVPKKRGSVCLGKAVGCWCTQQLIVGSIVRWLWMVHIVVWGSYCQMAVNGSYCCFPWFGPLFPCSLHHVNMGVRRYDEVRPIISFV